MALTSCRECHHEISDQARICPHCGARRGFQVGGLGLILAGVFALAVVVKCLGG